MQKLISKFTLSFLLLLFPAMCFSQFSFTNANSTMMPGSQYHSGCTVTVADWNSDGLDDIIVLDQAHDCFVEIQNANGTYTTLHIGDFTGIGSAWGMAAGDFDQNGFLDIVAGNGSVKVFMCDANGAMGAAISLPLTSIFLQNVTLGDFNNDGWLDIFGCHDVGEAKIWLNDGTGSFPAPTSFTGSISGNILTVTAMAAGTIKQGYYLSGTNVISNTKIASFGTGTGGVGTYILSNSSTVASTTIVSNIFNVNSTGSATNVTATGNDDSGNYGTTWSDYDDDGDLDFYVSKCRQNNTPDMRRHDVLHINDGTYHFQSDYDDINDLDQDSLLIDFICPDAGAQSWTTNFGDLDNDGDFDMIRTSYTQISEMWENDGTGIFTNITASSGFNIGTTFELQSQIEDFDNDGFQDVLLTGTKDIMFHNNGNMTFTISDDNIFPGQLGSFGSGDLNHDGFVDIYGAYNTIYVNTSSTDDVIYLNDGNNNHWVTFNLVGTVSNHGAVGAKIKIYTPLGIQMREVRAGESYGTQNTFNLHFGLGTITTIDSAVIMYPSGITNKLFNIDADQFITNVETGGCSIQSGNITATTLSLCAGGTLTLNGPSGFASYLWSNGATTQNADVTSAGDYSVLVSNGSCSAYTPSVHVISDAQNAPVVSTPDALKLCEGGSVTLNSTSATSYSWSDGSTTQSITVTQAGIYNVTIPGTGACPTLTSNDIVVNIISVTAPVGTDDNIIAGTTATLQATGSDVHWFDAAVGGVELGTGNNYTTPVLNSTTDYYAENHYSWGGGNGVVGEIYHSGTSDFSSIANNNIHLIFDVDSNVVLTSVKVMTDTPGVRRFMVLDNLGNIVDSASVYVAADSMVVSLNFNLSPGTDYAMTTDATVNQSSIGTITPRFKRSAINSPGYYPYVLNGFVTLTGNDIGNTSYYYYYDLHFEKPVYTCISDRVTVTAHVSTGISSFDENTTVDVYPNPSDGLYTIESTFNYSNVVVFDLLGKQIYNANGKVKSLNLSSFSKGSYLLQLTDANNQSVRTQLILE